MKNKSLVDEWLRRANSNLERAKAGIETSGITIPDVIKETSEQTIYAVDTRYPGDYEPVTESDYEQAVVMADRVFKWVEVKIEMIMKNID